MGDWGDRASGNSALHRLTPGLSVQFSGGDPQDAATSEPFR